MELHTVYFSFLALICRTRTKLCMRRHIKTFGKNFYHIGVTHKHLLSAVKAFKQSRFFIYRCRKNAVFAFFARHHFSAEHMSDELRSVTNSKHGYSERIELFIALWGILKINAVRSARKNYSYRIYFFDFIKRNIVRFYHRINAAFWQ